MGAGASRDNMPEGNAVQTRDTGSFSLATTPIPPSLKELFRGGDTPEATARRQKGNAAFQAKEFAEATSLYSEAIEQQPGDPRLYSNRSAAFAALGQHGRALSDAMMATQLQPAWPKGHFRLGVALLELRQWVDALDALSRCAAIEPANPLVQEKLQLAADKVQPGMRGAPGILFMSKATDFEGSDSP